MTAVSFQQRMIVRNTSGFGYYVAMVPPNSFDRRNTQPPQPAHTSDM
jgi:hypothetical protein